MTKVVIMVEIIYNLVQGCALHLLYVIDRKTELKFFFLVSMVDGASLVRLYTRIDQNWFKDDEEFGFVLLRNKPLKKFSRPT